MVTVSLSGPPFSSESLRALESEGVDFQFVDIGRDGWSSLDGVWAHVLGGPETISANDVVHLPGSLKVVCFVGTGYKSYVDVDALNRRGISVCYTPYANAWSTAEFAITLLLAGRRRVLAGVQQVSDGDWQPLEGRSIAESTIGVVGFGHVGQQVVTTLVRGFGAKVLVWNRTDKSREIIASGARPATLAEIFTEASAATLHVDAPTQPLIGRELLTSAPEGFVLVNTARAGVVDYMALSDVLRERPDMSVLSDVYPSEPVSRSTDTFGLLELGVGRFALTPHQAYLSDHASRAMADMVAANLTAALEGHPLPYRAG